MPKISVIVPVYNTGKYIERCLNSIINQTLKIKTEIIIINDGSTDDSDKTIKEYIEKYNTEKNDNNNNSENNDNDENNANKDEIEIRYYSKNNEGVAKTRNFGIEKSTGDYILFVDSDDYIDIDIMKKLNKYIEEDIDLIKYKLQRVNSNQEIIEKVDGPTFEKVSGEIAFEKLYSQDVLIDSPCVYLIKKSLFNGMEFKRKYHEDFGLVPLLIIKAKTVVSTPYYLYYYVQVSNSITRNENYDKTLQKMDDALFHYDNMLEEIKKMNLTKRTTENIKIYYTNAIILKLNELNDKEKKQYIQLFKQRKVYKNIKLRGFKQLIKRILLRINIELYLKMR